MKRTKGNTLRASWDRRERDVSFGWPDGPQVKPDAHMLYGVFAYEKVYDGRTFVEELKRRGYDVTTLRFSIMKDPAHPRWAEEVRPEAPLVDPRPPQHATKERP